MGKKLNNDLFLTKNRIRTISLDPYMLSKISFKRENVFPGEEGREGNGLRGVQREFII